MPHDGRTTATGSDRLDLRIAGIRTKLDDLTLSPWPGPRSEVRRQFCGILREIRRAAAPASADATMTLLLMALSRHEALSDRRGFEETDERLIRSETDAALAVIVPMLSPSYIARLPTRVMRAVADNRRGVLSRIVRALVPRLDAKACARWQGLLARRQPTTPHPYLVPQQKDHLVARQILARAAKQADLYAALQRARDDAGRGRSVLVAQVYLEAGRPVDALAHLPIPGDSAVEPVFMPLEVEMDRPRRRVVEADILEALGDIGAAQALRYACFSETLSIPALRAYLGRHALSADFDAEDWAMGVAMAFDDHRRTVRFFCDWGRVDLAKQRALEDAGLWTRLDDWGVEVAVAQLEEAEPVAAIVILRGLVRHACATGDPVYRPRIPGWMRKLAGLAVRMEREGRHRQEGISSHADFARSIGLTPDGKRRS